jgi:hypothetical protein
MDDRTASLLHEVEYHFENSANELLVWVMRGYSRLHRAYELADWRFIRESRLEGVWISLEDRDFYRENKQVAELAAGVVYETFRGFTHGQLLAELILLRKYTNCGAIVGHNPHADRDAYRNFYRWIPEGDLVREILSHTPSVQSSTAAIVRSHPDTPDALPPYMEGKAVSVNPAWPEMTIDYALRNVDCIAAWDSFSPERREEWSGQSLMVVYARPKEALAAA